ncbi:MAG: transcriptional regulator [Pseudomonadota bacterium]|jgi:DNA-binding transcriptional ArsR family regulator
MLVPQELVQTFAALGDPTRIAILNRLATDGDMTVQEIAQPFPMSLPAVSQHLKVLENAGLISRRREGQRRPCCLRVERLAEAAHWFEHTREAWQSRFARLERFLASVVSSQPNETKG